MAYLGRQGVTAPLTSADIPDNSITTAKIVDDNVTAAKIPAGAVSSDVLYLENATAAQELSGTFATDTERLYFNDLYTLTGNLTIEENAHLALGTIADKDVLIEADTGSTERTITGEGTLDSGNVLQDTHRTSLTDMTGELGSVVTGSPNLNLATGSIGSGVTGFTGVKEMDWWMLTVSATGNINPITSNLARCKAGGFTPIGAGMSESGGVFTFPSIGKWEVQYHWLGWTGSASSRYCTAHIEYTPNNGSNWYGFGRSTMGVYNYTNNTECNNHSSGYVDVIDVSTYKVRFYSNYENQGMYCYSSGSPSATASPGTSFMFKRLGDT